MIFALTKKDHGCDDECVTNKKAKENHLYAMHVFCNFQGDKFTYTNRETVCVAFPIRSFPIRSERSPIEART